MPNKIDSAKRVISGTWGEAWLNGEKVAECYGAQAKVTADKEEISMPYMSQLTPFTYGIDASGGLLPLDDGELLGEAMKNGSDPRFTIVLKLEDPDAYGAERVALFNVSFDDLTLMDWEAKTVGKVECPFTFSDFKYLDKIPA